MFVPVGVIAPYSELLANPITGSVAVVELSDIAKNGLPPLPTGTNKFIFLVFYITHVAFGLCFLSHFYLLHVPQYISFLTL